MLYRELIAVCSHIHTKHINTLCGQNVELLNVKLSVHTVNDWCEQCYMIYASTNLSRRQEIFVSFSWN